MDKCHSSVKENNSHFSHITDSHNSLIYVYDADIQAQGPRTTRLEY